MKIRIRHGLPYVRALVTHQGQALELENVVVDTGSAGTLFSADRMLALGLIYEPGDTIREVRGIGGREFVFTKKVDVLRSGELSLERFRVQIGAMQYGFQVDGILGLDFLQSVGAVIDLAALRLKRGEKEP